MDENLVIHAIQWKNNDIFKNRYTFFPNMEDRDETFKMLRCGQDPDAKGSVSAVTMIIRVETVDIPEEEPLYILTQKGTSRSVAVTESEFRQWQASLKAKERETLHQRVTEMKLEGMTNVEIAEVLEIPESSVRIALVPHE